MYLTISPQKLSSGFSQSSRDFVNYLEKENQKSECQETTYFFNQIEDKINPEKVVENIDRNTAKLKRSEPKFYSLTINPSQRELQHIGNNEQKLKAYTREVMRSYAQAFNREINGKPISPNDILYYAKIEHQRSYKGFDRQVIENRPFIKRIDALENQIKKIQRNEIPGNIESLRREVLVLRNKIPHKTSGQIIEEGTQKQGVQTHIHVIVSRKDASNNYSLSPGSKYRSSEVVMHGKTVKRGFNRDRFFRKSEKAFDQMFNYSRNPVESYNSRKLLSKDPHKFYSRLQALSPIEKKMAFSILSQGGLKLPYLNIAQNQVSFALKQIKKALQISLRSSSIGY